MSQESKYTEQEFHKKMAVSLQETIEKKYKEFQPNRGYSGEVSSRDKLYMLRYTHPKTVYIELGNIQNSRDQLRFIKKENRSAIAKWLCEGLIEEYKASKK